MIANTWKFFPFSPAFLCWNHSFKSVIANQIRESDITLYKGYLLVSCKQLIFSFLKFSFSSKDVMHQLVSSVCSRIVLMPLARLQCRPVSKVRCFKFQHGGVITSDNLS
jgi:hypothetical protein